MIFKDFMKQKPKYIELYNCLSYEEGHQIRSVCLKMEFSNKLVHILFYRYLDGVVDKVIGSIEGLRDGG